MKYLLTSCAHFLILTLLSSTTNVLAQPVISAPQILDFGNVGFEKNRTINNFIWNEGNELLEIENFFVTGDQFTAEIETTEIHPHMTTRLIVSFQADQVGTFQETLTLVSNDPNMPVLEIPITAQVNFSPPAFFNGQIDGNDVQLFWGVNTFEGDWLGYDKTDDLVGVMMGAMGTIRVGAKWPSDALSNFIGSEITKLAYIPVNPDVEYKLQIWEGENGENLLMSQIDQPPFYEIYTEVVLNSPVEIEAGKTYWFAIEATSFEDEQIVLAYNLQNTDIGLGDMIFRSDGWQRFNPDGFQGNWNIRALVQPSQGQVDLPETNALYKDDILWVGSFSNDLTLTDSPIEISGFQGRSGAGSGPEFIGYNLYRNDNLLNPVPLTTTEFLDEDLPNGIYTYGLTNVFDQGESGARTLTFQVGAPFLKLSRELILDSLVFDSLYTYEFTIYNIGGDILEWSMINSLPPYLEISQTAGTTESGDSSVLILEVNSTLLPAGDNNFFLTYSSNNIFQADQSVRLRLINEPITGLFQEDTAINFGMVPVGREKLMAIEFKNTGNVRTFMYPITLDNTDNFRANFTQWTLDPGESTSLLVYFTPDDDGFYSTQLRFNTFNPYSTETIEIEINGQGVFPPPVQLSGEFTGQGIELNWLPPGASPNELRYGTGEPSTSIMAAAQMPIEIGAKFTSTELMPYDNRSLTAVNLFLLEADADFTVKVYTDESGESPLYEIPVDDPKVNQWNEVELPAPLDLSGLDYLWISYQIIPNKEFFSIAADGGPAIPGKGDLVKIADMDWESLGSFNLNFNWIIKGVIESNGGLQPEISQGNGLASSRSSLNLEGYRVFRDGVQLHSNLIQETSFTDSDISEGVVYNYQVIAVYNLGESAEAVVSVEVPFNFTLPDGWDFTPTHSMHHIHLPEGLDHEDIGLRKGDLIGLFYERDGIEHCAGLMYWDGNHRVVTAYGSDPQTMDKDGFEPGETLNWKVYNHQTGMVSSLIARYDTNMPHHDGRFANMGLSMLTALTRGTVNTIDEKASSISLFPNPAIDQFYLKGLEGNAQISIYDMRGKLLKRVEFSGNPIDIREFLSGVYVLEIVDFKSIHRKFLIVR
ncbi:MAG: choice-of-anchor D domain-containing protein [Saprospirales bacterium]|nr:MAG: choice-of-anchor D domain-containing protein [Saprospirales bacterium]